jgi:hypothetical protein
VEGLFVLKLIWFPRKNLGNTIEWMCFGRDWMTVAGRDEAGDQGSASPGIT